MFSIFTTAWALAILFHLSTRQGGGQDPVSVALFVTAIAAVFYPAATFSLLILCILQIVQFWRRLPRAQTSEYFKFICGLCILSTYLWLSLAHSRIDVAQETWFLSFASLLRLATCLLFLYAVLHKLNWDFLNPEVSEASEFFSRLLRAIGVPFTRWLRASSPYLTLATELSIAAGLLFPTTRLFAISVLLVFFTMIGILEIVQFSSLINALAILFIDERVLGLTVSLLGLHEPSPHLFLGIACCIFFPSTIMLRRFPLLAIGTTAFSCLIGFDLAQAALRGGSSVIWPHSLFPLSPEQAALLILFSMNELGPYIGYKDWPVFRMYSNLWAGFTTNHLFLRTWLFIPFFKTRKMVLLSRATQEILYGSPGREDLEIYLPYSSLIALARQELKKVEGDDRAIEYVHQNTYFREDMANLGCGGSSWLDFIMPPRFFFHFACSLPLKPPPPKES